MKNYKLILAALLLGSSSCSVNHIKSTSSDSANNQHTASTPDTALFARMQMQKTIKVGEPVELRFTVYNNTGVTKQFCKWHTPFEPLMSKYLTVKDASGQEMSYKGAMAKRVMPPPPESYIKVNPKDTLSVVVDLLKAYDISKQSKYTIIYEGQNMSGLEVKDSITFNYTKR